MHDLQYMCLHVQLTCTKLVINFLIYGEKNVEAQSGEIIQIKVVNTKRNIKRNKCAVKNWNSILFLLENMPRWHSVTICSSFQENVSIDFMSNSQCLRNDTCFVTLWLRREIIPHKFYSIILIHLYMIFLFQAGNICIN
jgi:hypothetical protein